MGYNEASLFGWSVATDERTSCREIWTKSQREDIIYFLEEAQEELQDIIQFPLEPTWFADEQHPFSRIVIAKWGKIIDVGIRAVEIISSGAVVDFTDPEYGVVSINVDYGSKDLNDLHIFYPSTDEEILASLISYDSATLTLTIRIPAVRLMKYSLLDNTQSGELISEPTNFQTTVDIHRIYTDTSVQGKLNYRGNLCSSFCSESYDSVCEYVKNAEIGTIYLDLPNSVCCSRSYESIHLNYRAGMVPTTRMAELTAMRLAHSKMPMEPCGCDTIQKIWQRDRNIPTYQTRDRLDCPFGLSDGAWIAWRWACNMELKRASALI